MQKEYKKCIFHYDDNTKDKTCAAGGNSSSTAPANFVEMFVTKGNGRVQANGPLNGKVYFDCLHKKAVYQTLITDFSLNIGSGSL